MCKPFKQDLIHLHRLVVAKVVTRWKKHHLPVHKADWIHDGGLNDLSAGEYAPCHSIGLHIMGICSIPALKRNYFIMSI